jgi:hypothetical protein
MPHSLTERCGAANRRHSHSSPTVRPDRRGAFLVVGQAGSTLWPPYPHSVLASLAHERGGGRLALLRDGAISLDRGVPDGFERAQDGVHTGVHRVREGSAPNHHPGGIQDEQSSLASA